MKRDEHELQEELVGAIEADDVGTFSKIINKHQKLMKLKINIFKDTYLHYPAWQGALKVARFLIERGFALNQPGENGWTPLHYAANHSHPEVMELLLLEGADPNLRDDHNYTPLHYAITQLGLKGCSMVGLLLRKGAILDLKQAKISGEFAGNPAVQLTCGKTGVAKSGDFE